MFHMAETSIYDYTPIQAEVIRFYDLYRCSLMNKKYHAKKLKRAKFVSSLVETTAALSASSAIASLAIWKTWAGGAVFTVLLSVSAVASVIRSAFRLSENLDRHSRLAYAWNELALDMERATGAIRREGAMSELLRNRIDNLSERFQRIEMTDDIEGKSDLILRIQEEVDRAVPPDSLWLPSD
jgi:hypothetical protein